MWITAAAVSVPGSAAGGIVGCWALVIAAETGHWWLRPRPPAADATVTNPPDKARPRQETRPATPPWQEEPTLDDGEHDVFQRLTRARDPRGQDILYGTLRADLAADQRTVALHVAFCPPFATTPDVDVEQTSGPDVRIKIGQVLPYGARLDARLVRAPRHAGRIVVGIHVREAAADPNPP
jgi:hypothetical protein